jgi:acetyl esterase/lipase
MGNVTAEPADAAEIIRLWPDGPPSRIDDVGAEVAYPAPPGLAVGTTFLRNISEPTLSVFTPRAGRANGAGVVVAPGGAWMINAWDHEGLDVARWLAGAGFTAFLLKYRVQASPREQATFDARMAAMDGALATRHPAADLPRAISDLIETERYQQARAAAADDGRRAITIARQQAARLRMRPDAIGMIGFSAGAFLAVDVALDPRDAPLAFLGAIYGGETRGAPVPADAPPLFSVVAQDDLLWKIVEGVHADWSAADRPAELHVFARGAHGFGMIRQGTPSDLWPELFLAWVGDLALR